MKRYYLFIIILIAISAATIGAEMLLSEPIKADKALTDRLEKIHNDIEDYAYKQHRLPREISSVSGDHNGIAYSTVNSYTYKLCATFKTANRNSRPSDVADYVDVTQHDKGQQCFTIKADALKPDPFSTH